MKCYATANSPFARKVRIAAIETGLYDEVEWQMITREERAKMIPEINPLGKVPVAILDAGDILYDSPVICAYVDSLNTGAKLIPEDGAERWAVLTLEALGDGMADAVVAASQEADKPDDKRSQAALDRQLGKVNSALKNLDSQAASFRDPPSVGEIAVVSALGYLEFRDVVPGWRETYSNLGGWYAAIQDRRSVRQTAPS